MLRYLRILTWFLFTFGAFGLLSASFGIDTGLGVGAPVLALLGVQVVVAGLILAGFKLVKEGRLHPQVLSAGAIALILFYVVAGQIWMAVSTPERGANIVRDHPNTQRDSGG